MLTRCHGSELKPVFDVSQSAKASVDDHRPRSSGTHPWPQRGQAAQPVAHHHVRSEPQSRLCLSGRSLPMLW